jgi:hypothetical protein
MTRTRGELKMRRCARRSACRGLEVEIVASEPFTCTIRREPIERDEYASS